MSHFHPQADLPLHNEAHFIRNDRDWAHYGYPLDFLDMGKIVGDQLES